jgi:hypothetical protein
MVGEVVWEEILAPARRVDRSGSLLHQSGTERAFTLCGMATAHLVEVGTPWSEATNMCVMCRWLASNPDK